MYFDETSALNRPQHRNAEDRNHVDSTPAQQQDEGAGGTAKTRGARPEGPIHRIRDWKAANMLDSANNKLQELMQLLYLLSRDPEVPKDARYHVTMAQSEIALLAHVMRTSTQAAAGEAVAPAEGKTGTAHP